MFDFDTELARRYGGFASYPSDVNPVLDEATRDGAALDLYTRYNTTPKGVRLLRQRKIFVFRRTVVSDYPVDSEYLSKTEQ